MRDHSHHIEIHRDEAIELLLGACSFKPRTETVPLSQAAGRVLAKDVASAVCLPPTRTCRMDSVAVHWDSFEAAAAQSGEGALPDTSAWERGRDWQFANTGIAMPEGFDTAIVVEHCTFSEDGERVAFDAAPSARFAGTSAPGSRMKPGDTLVSARTILTPEDCSRIGMGGHTGVDVIAKPVVAFIPTGNELVPCGEDISTGKNYETNSLIVCGKIAQWGGIPLAFGIVPDNPELIKQAVRDACAQADIVVLNAGSSKGSDDWNVEMLEGMGQVLYHQTNHGPGHHSSAAVVDGTPVVGISGPPRGAGFTTDFYLWPVMRAYFGLCGTPQRISARLSEGFDTRSLQQSLAEAKSGKKLPGEQRPPEATDEGAKFYSVKPMGLSIGDNGTLCAAAVPFGSHDVRGYYLMPAGAGDVPPHAGDLIEIDLAPTSL